MVDNVHEAYKFPHGVVFNMDGVDFEFWGVGLVDVLLAEKGTFTPKSDENIFIQSAG